MRTITLIGMGRIGSKFAQMISGMDVKILYHGPREKPQYNHLGKYVSTLEELLRSSDIVSVHCPLNEETKLLFGKKEFEMMKKTAVFLNVRFVL